MVTFQRARYSSLLVQVRLAVVAGPKGNLSEYEVTGADRRSGSACTAFWRPFRGNVKRMIAATALCIAS